MHTADMTHTHQRIRKDRQLGPIQFGARFDVGPHSRTTSGMGPEKASTRTKSAYNALPDTCREVAWSDWGLGV